MGQKNGLHAFGYYSIADSKAICMKFKHYKPHVGGWPWQILGAIRAAATV